jgi:hypothetical protein
MALRFFDSCGDHYSSAQINRKWTNTVSGAVLAAVGRRGTNALQLSNGISYSKTLDNQPTWTIGFSYKMTSGLPFGSCVLVALIDVATTQVDLRMDATGHLFVTRNGTTLGVASINALSVGIENYIEFKSTIDPAAGTYEVRVNGSSTGWVPPAAGANTRATANSFAAIIQFGVAAINGANPLDDIYVCDGTGGAPTNTFLGDVRADAVLPSGAGANTGMTPSAGSNFQNVDDNPANDDTDFNSSTVVGTKDTYAMTDIIHNPVAIFGVQVNMVARKDDAGARSIAAVTRSGGVDTDGATQVLTTSYINYREILALDPNTGLAWTKAGVNAAEFGAKVAA